MEFRICRRGVGNKSHLSDCDVANQFWMTFLTEVKLYIKITNILYCAINISMYLDKLLKLSCHTLSLHNIQGEQVENYNTNIELM